MADGIQRLLEEAARATARDAAPAARNTPVPVAPFPAAPAPEALPEPQFNTDEELEKLLAGAARDTQKPPALEAPGAAPVEAPVEPPSTAAPDADIFELLSKAARPLETPASPMLPHDAPLAPPASPAEDRSLLSAFTGGVQRGWKNSIESALPTLQGIYAEATGDHVAAAQYALEAEAIQKQAVPQMQEFKQIKDFEDVLVWGAEKFGEQVPVLAATISTGLTGGLVTSLVGRGLLTSAGARALLTKAGGTAAGFGTAAGMETAGIGAELREATGSYQPGLALVAGLGAGALELVVPFKMARALWGGKELGKNLAGAVGKSVLTEAATEGGQEAIAIAARAYADPSYEMFGADAGWRIAESITAGGLVGGGVGGLTHSVSRRAGAERPGSMRRVEQEDTSWELRPVAWLREKFGGSDPRAREVKQVLRARPDLDAAEANTILDTVGLEWALAGVSSAQTQQIGEFIEANTKRYVVDSAPGRVLNSTDLEWELRAADSSQNLAKNIREVNQGSLRAIGITAAVEDLPTALTDPRVYFLPGTTEAEKLTIGRKFMQMQDRTIPPEIRLGLYDEMLNEGLRVLPEYGASFKYVGDLEVRPVKYVPTSGRTVGRVKEGVHEGVHKSYNLPVIYNPKGKQALDLNKVRPGTVASTDTKSDAFTLVVPEGTTEEQHLAYIKEFREKQTALSEREYLDYVADKFKKGIYIPPQPQDSGFVYKADAIQRALTETQKMTSQESTRNTEILNSYTKGLLERRAIDFQPNEFGDTQIAKEIRQALPWMTRFLAERKVPFPRIQVGNLAVPEAYGEYSSSYHYIAVRPDTTFRTVLHELGHAIFLASWDKLSAEKQLALWTNYRRRVLQAAQTGAHDKGFLPYQHKDYTYSFVEFQAEQSVLYFISRDFLGDKTAREFFGESIVDYQQLMELYARENPGKAWQTAPDFYTVKWMEWLRELDNNPKAARQLSNTMQIEATDNITQDVLDAYQQVIEENRHLFPLNYRVEIGDPGGGNDAITIRSKELVILGLSGLEYNARGVIAHEAVHAVKPHFTAEEWGVLVQAARQTKGLWAQISGAYLPGFRKEAQELKLESVEADMAVQRWLEEEAVAALVAMRAGGISFQQQVAVLLDRFIQLLVLLGQKLGVTRGWVNKESVLRSFFNGDIAARETNTQKTEKYVGWLQALDGSASKKAQEIAGLGPPTKVEKIADDLWVAVHSETLPNGHILVQNYAFFTPRTRTVQAADYAGATLQRSGSDWVVTLPGDIGGVGGSLNPATNMFEIGTSWIAEDSRGQGLGTAAYRMLIDSALSQGIRVGSDKQLSSDVVGVYQQLANLGYGVTMDETAVNFGERGLQTTNGKPVFVITRSPSAQMNLDGMLEGLNPLEQKDLLLLHADVAGYLYMNQNRKGFEVDMVHVALPYRNAKADGRARSFAGDFYKYASEDLKTSIKPSGLLTADGYAMHKRRDPHAVRWYVYDSTYELWYSPNKIRDSIRMYERGLERVPDSPAIRQDLRRMKRLEGLVDPKAWQDPELDRMFKLSSKEQLHEMFVTMRQQELAHEENVITGGNVPSLGFEEVMAAKAEQAQAANARQLKLDDPKLGAPPEPAFMAAKTVLRWRELTPEQRRRLHGTWAEADRISHFSKKWWGIHQMVWVNPHIDRARNYLTIIEKWAAKVEQWVAIADDTARIWDKLPEAQKNNLAELLYYLTEMRYRTPQEVTNKVVRQPTQQELAAVVAGLRLTPETMQVFDQITQNFDAFLTEMERISAQAIAREFAGQRVNGQPGAAELKALAELSAEMTALRQRPYFPMTRFGEWVLSVRDPYDNNKILAFYAFESQKERNDYIRTASRRWPGTDISIGRMPEEAMEFMGVPGPLLRRIKAELPGLTASQKDWLDLLEHHTAPERSFRKRWLDRKETPGYSLDAFRVFANYFQTGARYLARLEFKDVAQEEINQLREEAKTLADSSKRQMIGDFMQDHLKYMIEGGRDWSKVKSFIAIWHLGFSPMAAFMNLTQVPMVTMPYLSGLFGDGPAFRAVVKGTSALKSSIAGIWRNSPWPGYEKGRQELIAQGKIDAGQAPELAAYASANNLYRTASGTTVARGLRTTAQASMWMFGRAERINREFTYHLAFRLTMENLQSKYVQDLVYDRIAEINDVVTRTGVTFDEATAIVVAKDAIDRTHGIYAPWARPAFLRNPLASTIGAFFLYTQMMLFSMRNNPGAIKHIFMLALFGGLMGLPGADDMEKVITAVARRWFGKDFSPKKAIREYVDQVTKGTVINKVAPDILLHGISRYGFGLGLLPEGIGAPRFDASGNVSMGRIIPGLGEAARAYGTSRDWNDVMAGATQQASGAGFGVMFNLLQLMASPPGSSDWKKWEKALPRALKAQSRAIRFYTQEKEVDNSGATFARFDRRDPDDMATIIAQFLGANPTKLNAKWEAVIEIRDTVEFYRAQRKALYEQMFKAVEVNDLVALQQVMRSITDMNQELQKKGFGSLSVNVKQLQSSMRNRMRSRVMKEQGLPTIRSEIPVYRQMQESYPTIEWDVTEPLPRKLR